MRLVLLLLAFAMPVPSVAERLEGHGGPVMDVAVEGERILTASFDNSVGIWHEGAPRWLEGHRAAVNTVLFLTDNRAATGGDDFAVIVWDLATGRPLHRLEGHRGKVADLAVSSDGELLASASWDGTVRLWDVEGGAEVAVLPHDANVNAVVFAGDRLLSAASDGTIVDWDVPAATVRRTLVRHGFGVNRLALGPGWLAYGAVDGGTLVIDLETGAEIADLSAGRRPILALATGRGTLAVGDGEGHILVVETEGWSVLRDFRAAVNGPIWALAFTADGTGLIAGSLDASAAVWPLDGEGPLLAATPQAFHTAPAAVGNGERQFLRKCSVCHTLGPDGSRRAGPSLHGLFGRSAGSLPGYAYSAALSESGIVWTAESVDRLFELGPDHFTPGSKMPTQRITSVEDRTDLIAFLRRATAAENRDVTP